MMGLVSDGGVHSHNGHIYGLLELAKRQGVEKVYVHCFLDGRDTPPASGKEYVEALEAKMKEIGIGEVASVSGRYYAMDRDNRWDRSAGKRHLICFQSMKIRFTNIFMNCPGKRRNGIKLRSIRDGFRVLF